MKSFRWLYLVLLALPLMLADADEARNNSESESHGLSQLQRMLKDRPSMGFLPMKDGGKAYQVDLEARVFQKIAALFSPQGGFNSFWDATPPELTDAPAESRTETSITPGIIRIAEKLGGMPLESEEMWANCVFELYNVQNVSGWTLLENAMLGKISRQEYITSMVKKEYDSHVACERFYRRYWKPWCVENGISTLERNWNSPIPPFSEWLAIFADHPLYPEYPFGPRYDRLTQFLQLSVPGNLEAGLRMKVSFYTVKGDIEKANVALQELVKVNPKESLLGESFLSIGLLQCKEKDWNGARQSFRMARSLDKQLFFDASCELLKCYFEMKDENGVREELEALLAISLNPAAYWTSSLIRTERTEKGR